MALFRLSLIAPLLTGVLHETQTEYLERVCAIKHNVPGLGLREFSPATLKRWLYAYRCHGIEGLERKKRTDQGDFRSLNPETANAIDVILEDRPSSTGVQIYKSLLVSGLDVPSLSTVQRYIKKTKPLLKERMSSRRLMTARRALSSTLLGGSAP